MTDWKKRALDLGGKALKKGSEIAAEKAKEAQVGITKAAEEYRVKKAAEQAEAKKLAALEDPECLRIRYDHEDVDSPALFVISHFQETHNKKGNRLLGKPFDRKTLTAIALHLSNGVLTVRPDGYQMGLTYEAPFADLSAVELVNMHQWTGGESVVNRNQAGGILWRERPAWDVAATNVKTGERIIFLRAHCLRDDAFLLTNRLNILLGHAHQTLLPWDETANVEQRREAWGSPDWGWN